MAPAALQQQQHSAHLFYYARSNKCVVRACVCAQSDLETLGKKVEQERGVCVRCCCRFDLPECLFPSIVVLFRPRWFLLRRSFVLFCASFFHCCLVYIYAYVVGRIVPESSL